MAAHFTLISSTKPPVDNLHYEPQTYLENNLSLTPQHYSEKALSNP